MENGLYNYGARLYDSIIGRFISPDTIVSDPYNPQSLNRYSYCLNNPLIYVDPSGNIYQDPDTGEGWLDEITCASYSDCVYWSYYGRRYQSWGYTDVYYWEWWTYDYGWWVMAGMGMESYDYYYDYPSGSTGGGGGGDSNPEK